MPEQCEKCSFKTCRNSNLVEHIKNNHSGIFYCESCDYSCENKQTFDNHVTRTHNPKNVVVKKRVWKKRIKGHFECAHCPWTGSGLSKHWKFEHPEEPLPFLCHLCDHRSCDEYYLKHHIRSVHGDKIYKCDICGKESKHGIAAHMKTHMDHKEFTCDVCAKGLRTLRSLRKHLFTKHQIEFDGKEKESILRDLNRKPKMKPVEAECLNCHYKTFNSIEDFNKHVLICYGAKLTDTNHDVEFVWWVVEFSNFVIQN